ncbi:MAG: ABC transporter ATP-binding protein [Kiritimatiellia bacterium]
MSDILVYRDVSVFYRSGNVAALREVSLKIGQGERVALMGLNGSGKTTLLSATAGLLRFSGEIHVCGLMLSHATERAVRDKLGFLFGVPDHQILFPNVLDDVAFSLERRGVRRACARERATMILTTLGIGALAECSPHHLSQGQRQRVALAGALLSEPPLLLLDEPSASLDPVGKEELATLLDKQTATMLIATHDLAFATRVCYRFVILDGGAVIEDSFDPTVVAHYESSQIAAVKRK